MYCHWTFDLRTFDPRDQIPCLSVAREFGPGGGTEFPRKFERDPIPLRSFPRKLLRGINWISLGNLGGIQFPSGVS